MRGEASPAGNISSYNELDGPPCCGPGRCRPLPRTALAARPQELAAVYRRRIITTYFGCGVVASVVLGCAMLLPLLYAHPGTRRSQAVAVATSAEHRLGTAVAGLTAPSLLDVEVNSFELPIRRSERASAAFPLEITGGGPADAMSGRAARRARSRPRCPKASVRTSTPGCCGRPTSTICACPCARTRPTPST